MIDKFFAANLHRGAIGWFLGVCLVIALLNVPKQQIRLTTFRSNAKSTLWTEPLPSPPSQELLERSYGWPYSRSMDATPEVGSLPSFVLVSLNVLIALAIALVVSAVAVSACWFHQRVLKTASTVHKVGLAGTLVAGMAGSAVLLHRELNAARALPRELENYGIVEYAIKVPVFVAQRVPVSWLRPIMHVEGIRLAKPPGELLQRALDELSPRGVSLSGNMIDVALWSKLAQSQSIQFIHLSDCAFIDFVNPVPGTSSSLQSLTLTHCKGADRIIPTIRQFPKLQVIDFAESPTDLAVLCISLPTAVKTVRLSLDNTGCGSLQVHDLDHLESLTLRPSHRSSPRNVYSIDLCNLSQLSRLAVSSSLCFDLTAVDVRRLSSIVPITSRTKIKSEVSRSTSLSIRNLVIKEAPGLQEISLGAEHLQSLVLKSTPNLQRLSIVQSRHNMSMHNETGAWKRAMADDQLTTVNGWIADIAKCDGPASLDLSGQSLHNVDLSPLGKNLRIRELLLSKTDVHASQLTAIDHGNRIKSLNLRYCKIDSDDMRLLLASFAGVETLMVDTYRLTSMDLVDQPKLNSLLVSTTQAAQRVKIVGCPNLAGHLILGRELESLELRDAASLESLSIRGPVPADMVLDGLRDLEVAELAGSNIRQEHFDALLNCKSIRELTLAIPSLPADTLRKIGQFNDLAVLNVPGAEIDDEVVATWGRLRHLQEVNLSHTNVTGKILGFLAGCPDLRRLNLSHTNVQPEDLEAVSQMKNLLDIDVAGIGMTPDILRRCLKSRMVDRINLSGSVINNEMLDILVSKDAASLRFVGLKHCRLDDKDVLKLATSKPNLAMDLEGNHLRHSVLENLAAQGRLISSDDMQGFDRWTERLNGRLLASNGSDVEPAKVPAYKRPYSKPGDASTTTIAVQRAVRSALRFTWGHRVPKLELN